MFALVCTCSLAFKVRSEGAKPNPDCPNHGTIAQLRQATKAFRHLAAAERRAARMTQDLMLD